MSLVPMGGPPVPQGTLEQLIAAMSRQSSMGAMGELGAGGARALGPGSIPLGPVGSSGSAQAMGNAASRMAAQAAGTGAAGGATAADLGGAVGASGLSAALSGIRGAPGYLLRNPRALLKGAGRGGVAGIAAGVVADPIIEGVVPGSNGPLEQTLQGAAAGAGVGAGVGSVIPGVGTAIGAGVGGLIGGGIGYFTANKGEKKSVQSDIAKLNSIVSRAQLDPDTQNRILRQFDVEYNFAESDKERKAAVQNARANVLTAIASPVQTSPRLSAQDILALQMVASNFLDPHATELEQQGAADAAVLNELASSLPTAALQSSTRIQAQNRLGGDRKLAAAYRAQAQLLPATYAIQLEQSYRNQQAQQAIAQMNSGQATSLQQLLSG